LGYALKTL